VNIFDAMGRNLGEGDPSDHWNNIRVALGWKKDMPPRPGFESELLRSAEQMRSESAAFSPLIKHRMQDITDTRGETYRARAKAGADTAQANAGSTPFQRAMNRGRALSRIGMQGQTAVASQSIRDRVGMARFGQSIRAGTARDLGALSTVQGEATAANMRADQQNAATYANAAGALGGIAANYWRNRQPTPQAGAG
jgi:hypothetical protein